MNNQAGLENGTTASYQDAPTRTVTAAGVTFAYRELAPTAGTPMIFPSRI
ncbi:hypothetical protein [Frankia sp. CiP3]|nr:hypothetical protein [Frankia sp. CiP3]